MKNAHFLLSLLKKILALGVLFAFALSCLAFFAVRSAFAMPFYHLQPQDLVLRSSFCTCFSSSTTERKHNIMLASNSLNNTFVDVSGEFSFNLTVGERTENRGYKKAKIIVSGEFVDGIGGGVCQVSSTLYNAVLLAGLEIVEYHPHSLPVSYVAPSFDAMVNSGWADLKFRNNTHNPIIIKSFADENKITIEIYGQKLTEKYSRYSVMTKTIAPLEDQIVFDIDGEYPDLFEGEYRKVRFGKNGYSSEGYLIVQKGNKKYKKKIRSDTYNSTRGLIVYGTAKKTIEKAEPILVPN